MIYTLDSLEFLKSRNEFEFDINYSDPPYALGSEIIIREDGKVDYKKAVDFMSKWDMPTGDYWEEWFKEAYRTLKYGGTLIMFGMDRQLLLFKYYAQMAGFVEQQSMYWYYISGFPKATDLSKMIDSKIKTGTANTTQFKKLKGDLVDKTSGGLGYSKTAKELDVRPNDYNKTSPQKLENFEPETELGKKYEGYKYSIAPLKQCNETIMIFKKPYKTGSCLHDTLAMENGDKETTCGAVNIDGNRVETNELNRRGGATTNGNLGFKPSKKIYNDGRFPAQTFIDNGTAEILDTQSDVSKILHKIEPDLYIYQPKVSKSERNAGLDEFEEKPSAASEFIPNHTEKAKRGESGNPFGRWTPLKNNHPTLKPIDLNYKILKLYKTPNEQSIVYPFAGAGSEVIGGIKAGFNNWVGCELSEDYVDIAKARIEYWQDQFNQKKQIDLLKGE